MLTQSELTQKLMEAEGPRLEFNLLYDLNKPNDDEKKNELTKDVTSLANTGGRNPSDFTYLIIGAGDQSVLGGARPSRDVRADGHTASKFIQIINARIHPPLPNLNYEEIEVGGVFYGVVEIPPSPHIHEFVKDLKTPSGKIWHKHEVVIRRGESIGTASEPEIKLMREQKENWSSSGAPPLKKLTEWLSDRKNLTQTAELIREETRLLYQVLNKADFLQQEQSLTLTELPDRIKTYDQLILKYAKLFAFGSYYGDSTFKSIWPKALSTIGQPDRQKVNLDAFVRLRFYPSLFLFYAGGITSISNNNYENLAALFKESRIQIYSSGPNTVAFSLVPPRLLQAEEQRFLNEAVSRHLKLNAHLFIVLTSALQDLIHSPDEFHEAFMCFEYLFALLIYQKEGGAVLGLFNSEREFIRGHQSYGKATLPVIDRSNEDLARLGVEWPPLKYGVFTGSLEEFIEFKTKADKAFLQRGAEAVFGQ